LKQGNHAKPNSYVQYIFKDSYIQPNEEGLETRGIDEIFKDIRQNLIEDIKKALVNTSTSKIRMRLEVEMFKRIMGFDGDCEEQIIKYNISSNPSKLIKTNLESTLEKLKIEIVNKFEKIDDKMPSSGWRLRRYIHLGVDIFETRPVRGSSYIPTPEKYGNSRTGLINIKNNDQECFRWCMKYHQSKKENDCRNISALRINMIGMIIQVSSSLLAMMTSINLRNKMKFVFLFMN
jgi:hypothetical protein